MHYELIPHSCKHCKASDHRVGWALGGPEVQSRPLYWETRRGPSIDYPLAGLSWHSRALHAIERPFTHLGVLFTPVHADSRALSPWCPNLKKTLTKKARAKLTSAGIAVKYQSKNTGKTKVCTPYFKHDAN